MDIGLILYAVGFVLVILFLFEKISMPENKFLSALVVFIMLIVIILDYIIL